MRRAAVALLAALVALGLAACTDEPGSPERSLEPGPGDAQTTDAVVTSVTDGDTVRVRTSDGADEPVRLIGIDTPEVDPRIGVECFGREASAQTMALLPVGTAVRLERDAEERDRYDRLLSYVYRASDGLFVNEALVAGGWAAPYRFPPNVRYADRFSDLGAQARAQGLGLWGVC